MSLPNGQMNLLVRRHNQATSRFMEYQAHKYLNQIINFEKQIYYCKERDKELLIQQRYKDIIQKERLKLATQRRIDIQQHMEYIGAVKRVLKKSKLPNLQPPEY